MNEIGLIIPGTQINGIKSLFINSYVHNIRSLNFYKKMNRDTRMNLLTKVAVSLSKECNILCYVDSEDKNVVYSIVVYTLDDKGLTVYFAYTKYPFRGYGFCRQILDELESKTSNYYHAIPRQLGEYKIWDKYKQIRPYYPKT